jgi:hypothetical protein
MSHGTCISKPIQYLDTEKVLWVFIPELLRLTHSYAPYIVVPFVPELCKQSQNAMHAYVKNAPNYGKVDLIMLVTQSSS